MSWLFYDYEPKKGVGLYELDGLLGVLAAKVGEMEAAGDPRAAYYEGARIALSIMRRNRVEHQGVFMEMFGRDLDAMDG